MALSRYTSSTSLLGGVAGINRENSDALLGRGKPRLTTGTNRTALGNISNRNSALSSQYGTLKGTYKETAKTRGMVTKNTFIAPNAVDKENQVAKPLAVVQEAWQDKEAEKPEAVECQKTKVAESPMDTRTTTPPANRLPTNVVDIDRDDKENPQLVSEYVNDIYDYMRELENRFSTTPQFLDGREVNGRMRGILVDWLVQVHLRFHLLQETLYLTVAIIDRFLQIQEVSRSKLQLVGVTSMLIASKYEEMYAPEIADFVYITDNAYSKSDIRKMECMILRTLDFNLGRPLPLHFLRRNSKAGEVDANKHTLAKYLMELTLVDYGMVHYAPSQISAAALCLSIKALDDSAWNETLEHYSKYSEEELMPIMQKMASLVLKSGTGKLTAIKTKYSSSKFMRICSLPVLSGQLFKDLAAKAQQS